MNISHEYMYFVSLSIFIDQNMNYLLDLVGCHKKFLNLSFLMEWHVVSQGEKPSKTADIFSCDILANKAACGFVLMLSINY